MPEKFVDNFSKDFKDEIGLTSLQVNSLVMF